MSEEIKNTFQDSKHLSEKIIKAQTFWGHAPLSGKDIIQGHLYNGSMNRDVHLLTPSPFTRRSNCAAAVEVCYTLRMVIGC